MRPCSDHKAPILKDQPASSPRSAMSNEKECCLLGHLCEQMAWNDRNGPSDAHIDSLLLPGDIISIIFCFIMEDQLDMA